MFTFAYSLTIKINFMPTTSLKFMLGPTQITDLVTRANASRKQFHLVRIDFQIDNTTLTVVRNSVSAYPADNSYNEITDIGGATMRIPGCPFPPECASVVFNGTEAENIAAMDKCHEAKIKLFSELGMQ